MKTKSYGQVSQNYDMSGHLINIDTILDSIVDAEKEHGQEPSVELAVYDRSTGNKYRRFQKRSPEEEEAMERSRKANNPERETTKISRDGTPVHDPEDDLYICEYCGKLRTPLGKKYPKYDMVVCDSCQECLGCVEFAEYECSGCSYSRFREGVPYSELVSLNDTLSEHDMQVIMEVEEVLEMSREQRREKYKSSEYDDHWSYGEF